MGSLKILRQGPAWRERQRERGGRKEGSQALPTTGTKYFRQSFHFSDWHTGDFHVDIK